ncbi:MAG: hypothetical protein ACRDTJ_06460 [Pseudonocardiaceae bacterium]
MTDQTDVREAVACALERIEALPPGRDAFTAAAELGDDLAEAVAATANLRAVIAARLKAEENLSLGGLAAALAVSKSRAAQLVNNAAESGVGHAFKARRISVSAVDDTEGHGGT